MSVIEGRNIYIYRLLTLKAALKLEVLGMKRSKSPSVYSIVKKEFNLKGSKASVMAQFTELVNQKMNS